MMQPLPDKAVRAGALALLAALPLGLMFQGLDVTDTGWVLANYRNFFSAPESVSYWFHLWFTNLLGGLWDAAFGAGGLLSFRFAGVLLFWLTVFLVFRTYRASVRPRHLYPALLMGLVFHFPSKITTIHYNNVSALLLVLAVFFLLAWVRKEKRVLLAASGVAVALAFFARLPNLLGLLFGGIVAFAGFYRERTWKAVLKDLVFFFGGFVLAAAAVLAAMKALGHLELYLATVKELFSGSKEELSHYGSNTIEKKFILDHGRALIAAGAGLLGLGLYRSGLERLGGRRLALAGTGLLAVLVAAASWFYLYDEAMPVVYFLVGLVYLTAAFVLLLPDEDRGFTKCAGLASAVVVAVLSIGSDTGMKVGAYGLLFGLPFVLKFWLDGPDFWAAFRSETKAVSAEGGFLLTRERRAGIFVLVLAGYAAFSLPFLYRGTYRDSPDRHKMTASVDHPQLRGVLTTPERAKALGEVLKALETYAKPGDRLITFESVPMIQFLARTRPYLSNAWPILYLPSEFERNLKKALASGGPLPPAVLAKKQTRSENWPKSGKVSSTETAVRDREILEKFFRENGYKEVWENEAFRILAPGR